MDAAQGLQLGWLEALHADGQAIDAEAAVVAEFGLFESARVGFQSDLDVVGKADTPLQPFENPAQCLGGKQAGRAATEENRAEPAALDLIEILVEIGQQRRDVFIFRQLRPGRMGIEVAVRALAHAPGDMHVGRQRRQLESLCLILARGSGLEKGAAFSSSVQP